MHSSSCSKQNQHYSKVCVTGHDWLVVMLLYSENWTAKINSFCTVPCNIFTIWRLRDGQGISIVSQKALAANLNRALAWIHMPYINNLLYLIAKYMDPVGPNTFSWWLMWLIKHNSAQLGTTASRDHTGAHHYWHSYDSLIFMMSVLRPL